MTDSKKLAEFSRLIAQIHRRQHLHVRKKPPAASAEAP